MYINYYEILDIQKSASQDEVKKAYRKLARKYHPDVNPNDDAAKRKFQEINEANEVLSDPEKRKKYDQYGENRQHADEFEQQRQNRQQYTNEDSQGSRRYTAEGFGGADFEAGGFSDFFESMFGSMSGGGRSRSSAGQMKYKGQDYNAELHLNLSDVYVTQKHTITVNGEKIRLTIPAGVENGQTIKIKGHGGEGINGGTKGDLYLTFVLKNNTTFKRYGNDLHKVVDLELYTAVLGGGITIETMSGKVKLKVQPETQNGSKVKLKGKGFSVYKQEGVFGDLYVTYHVRIPTNLTEKQKHLFEELSKI
ncbi:MAG: DnaJ C-terminal domain-containing protein [Paludibacteraceae bacterium]